MVGRGAGRRRRRADQHRLQGRVPPPPARRLGSARACSSSGRWSIASTPSSTSCPTSSTWSWSTTARNRAPEMRSAHVPRRGARRGTTLLGADDAEPHGDDPRRRDLGTFIYTGGTTGPSKGCMLSHNYHERPRAPDRHLLASARPTTWCGRRCRCSTSTPSSPPCSGRCVFGGRAAIYRPLLGVELLAGDEPHRRHDHVDARHDGVPARPRRRPARDAAVGRARGEHDACACSARRRCPSRSTRSSASASASTTFSGAYGVTEASLVSWQPPGVENKPNAAGRASTTSTSTCGSSTTTTTSCRASTDGEIVVRPEAPAHDVRGLLGPPRGHGRRPAATGGTTPATSAGSTTTATSTSSTARPTTSAAAARTSRASRSSASSWATARSPTSPCTPCRAS